MIRRLLIVGAVVTALMAGHAALAQVPQQPEVKSESPGTKTIADRVAGEVTAVDSGNKKLTLQTTDGTVFSVTTDDKTQYRRVPPGETTLDKASVIAFADIGVGDKTIVRGKTVGNEVAAQALIVVNAQEIKQKQIHDRADWKKRGIQGTIAGMNPGTQALMVRMMTANGPAPIHLTTAGRNVRYVRYGPDAVSFSDAKSSSFEELEFGDSIRALGNRSPDGSDFLAEEIISGSFQMVGGTITDVNRETGEVKIIDVKSKQPFTIVVAKGSKLRRLPPELLKQMEETIAATPAPVPGGIRTMTPGGQTPAAGPGGTRTMTPGGQTPAAGPGGTRTMTPGAQTPATGPGATRTMTPGAQTPATGPAPQQGPRIMTPGQSPGSAAPSAPAVDYGEVIENLPPISIADLKVGDGIIVSSTKGPVPTRTTAIMLAAGVESFLKRHEANAKGSAQPLDLALPGIGGP